MTVKNACLIWDGVEIGDEVFVGPRVTFTNDLRPRIGFAVPAGEYVRTTVRHGATLGANVTVVCGVTVGRYAMAGAGAVISRDVPDHVMVLGVPARAVGWVCVCGASLADDLVCDCGRRFEALPDGGLSSRPTSEPAARAGPGVAVRGRTTVSTGPGWSRR